MAAVTTTSTAAQDAKYFDLHVDGIGYVSRIRHVNVKKGPGFLACTISAMYGSSDPKPEYTKFDVRVSGSEAQEIILRLKADVDAERKVMITFRIGDIFPEAFMHTSGEKAGTQGLSIKGRLLQVKRAWINRVPVEIRPNQAPADSAAPDASQTPQAASEQEFDEEFADSIPF